MKYVVKIVAIVIVHISLGVYEYCLIVVLKRRHENSKDSRVLTNMACVVNTEMELGSAALLF